MAGIRPRFGEAGALSISYTPTEALSAGAVVEPVTGDRKVQKATSGSLIACGVALDDVVATRTVPHDVIVDQEYGLTVVRGCVVPVVFDDAATVGQKLWVAATAGQVTPVVAGADVGGNPARIIGQAINAVSAGEEGLAYIF